MSAAARKASRGLIRDFGEVENLQVSRKGPANFVTAADNRAEKTLRQELERVRPGYSFLLEEAGPIVGTDPAHRWLIDPLDGTTNFLHGVPHFAVSIALERERKLVAGVVYDPVKDEMFWAEKGKGAFLNDRRLRVSARASLVESLIATGIPYCGRPGHDLFHRELQALTDQVAGIRRFGSAALDLAYVAAGRYDGFWERGLAPWDIAAGIVLVREAGGIITEIGGAEIDLESPSILAGNQALHQPLSQILARAGS
jgi:myo-inositol-1(or 4)-monophosphatase